MGAQDPALTGLLRDAGTRWSAAAISAQGAAGLELASGTAVMAIGGFSGGDPAPTLEQFQAWVARRARCTGSSPRKAVPGTAGPGAAVASAPRSGPGSPSTTPTTVGGATVYDLTAPPH